MSNTTQSFFAAFLAMLSTLVYSSQAIAEAEVAASNETAVYLDEWQFDAGITVFHRQQAWKGVDTLTTPIPLFAASYGRWGFLKDGLLSYALPEVGVVGFTAGLAARVDGYDSNGLMNSETSDHPVFIGYQSPDEDITLNLTAEWSLFSLRLDQDISNNSGALGARLGMRIPIYSRARLSVSATLSVDWLGKDYSRYIYGIEGGQIDNSVGRSYYQPQAATNYSSSLSASYRINKQWSVVSGLEYTKLDATISTSPLVAAKHLSRLFVMANYRF